MTRSRVGAAAAVLLLAWAALLVPAALAQTPSPSPSPSGSGVASPSASAASPSTSPQRESLALLLSAEPATVEAGSETVLVAQVTNTGTTTVDEATLAVTLPRELELVSAFPAPASTAGGTLSFALGPLDPNDSSVVQITALGAEVVDAATVAATASSGDVVATDEVDVSVVVTGGGPAGLVVESRTEEVLTQVGSMMRYVVTVSNDGNEDLENVLVVDLAPEEVEVVSVDIVDEVEAVQIGESRGRYDIVWNLGSLPAGSSVDLPWDGKARSPGDLTAVNSVRGLLGQTETVRSTSRSFLADEGPRDVENPRFEPIEKRVVTFVDPPPPPAQPRAGTQPTVVLPFTGASLDRFVFAGIMLVLAGLFVTGGARLASGASGRAFAGAVLAGLVLAACVGGGDGGGTPDGAAPRTSATDDPRGEDAEVKGERIVRPDEDEESTPAPDTTPRPSAPPTSPPATTTPVAPATSAPPAVAAPTAPPATDAPDPEPVRVVEIVHVGLADLPVESLESRGGDNTVSFGWDEATGITSASSGTRFGRGRGSELTTDLTTGDGAIVNRLTLKNTHDAARLEVTGRLVHEVYSGSRLVARLRSAPIDVVLAPGGSVVARFSYLVPTGDYTVEASFESQ